MAKAKGAVDQFANIASIGVTESAANTLTFKKLETGISLMDKAAWVISRIEYYLSNLTLTQFADDGDMLDIGLVTRNNLTNIVNPADPAVVDYLTVVYMETGALSGFAFNFIPQVVKDFASLPGGGLVVPPNPLYLAAKGTGCAAANSITARIYYTILELVPDDMWQLMQARQVTAS